MTIDDFSQMATTLLAISLSSERLVTLAKTTFPSKLAVEAKHLDGSINLKGDQARRLTLIALSIVFSWITAAFLVNGKDFDLLGWIQFGGNRMPTWLAGILASGGSTFWGNILEYTKATKDLQTQRKANETLAFNQAVQQMPVGDQTIQSLLTNLSVPDFDLAESRVKRQAL